MTGRHRSDEAAPEPAAPDPAAANDSEVRRRQIGSDVARTVLEAAAQRLTDAVAEYEAALDRHPLMSELQFLDREVARAEREYASARRESAAG